MKVLISCFLLLGSIITSAQRQCFTPVNSPRLQLPVPNIPASRRDTLLNEVITIPVVIHILYDDPVHDVSDAAVRSQLKVLNNDFRKLNVDIVSIPAAFTSRAADPRIIFCIARVDPKGRPTKGIIHKYTHTKVWTADDAMKFSALGGDDAWDSKHYLNIWVCNLLGRNLGYSSLPGTEGDKDGVVIKAEAFGTLGSLVPFNMGRTATHEIGHWLGLKHLWGDAECGDDGITDTPPQQTYNNGCPTFPHTSRCSVDGSGDMFMNFMDFTDDACMHMFSGGQATKMRSLFSANGARNSFLKSSVCDSALAQGMPVPSEIGQKIDVVTLYPNPATSQITIEDITKSISGKTLKIYNMFGLEVLTIKLSSQKNIILINHLIAGSYIAKIGEGIGSTTLRFIKL